MKIYGKTFGQVFEMLPWAYKAVVVLGLSFLLFIFVHMAGIAWRGKDAGKGALVVGRLDNQQSMYDPSLAAAPEVKGTQGQIFLAFTNLRTIDASTGTVAPSILLARAPANCGGFSFDSFAFQAKPDDIVAPDNTTTLASGLWQYETPSIVYDGGDTGREWKIYAYKYFWATPRNLPVTARYGGIVRRHAAASTGALEWSDEEWVMAPAKGYPPPPYEGQARILLNTLSPALADVRFYARPSVVVEGKVTLMALSAFTGAVTPDRTVLFASFDHGQSWKYVGTPMTAKDARGLGYKIYRGATLLMQDNKLYLAAVFGDDKVDGLGTFIFPFTNIDKAEIRRDADGSPALLKHIPRQSEAPVDAGGGGFATFSPACGFGILTGEMSGLRNLFQLFMTLEWPDGKKPK
jgi:hypothetical protein